MQQEQRAPNAIWLLSAGFAAILAAGVGFAIRGGILDNWQRDFGFTAEQIGKIAGGGMTGFCFGIIIGGIVADKIGYGKLVIAAFIFHLVSAFATFAADGQPKKTAYTYLFWGSFIFAIANGTLEAVANPLVATLFPDNRTHYLNILHASWPAGLILGGALGWVLDDQLQWHWKYQLALFLVPTAIYGFMFFGQKMPRSEASEKGLTLGEMFQDVGVLGGLVVCTLLALFLTGVLEPFYPANPDTARNIGYGIGAVLLLAVAVLTGGSFGSLLLLVLFLTHALIGAVELGTDGWIQNITGNILSSQEGKFLFVFTSSVMFALRFCANFIEKKLGLSPIGLLLVCSVLAFIGLQASSRVESFGMALVALTIYGVGKTFFWPTMLAIAGDRFPRTGAVAMSIMGGIGMLSAGLIGSPGLGYCKDRFAGEELKQANPALYEKYKAEQSSKFLFLPEAYGLDGKKLGAAKEVKLEQRNEEQKAVAAADIRGDRRTLVADSFIPAAMAAIYLLLLLYFKAIGGYKAVHIDGTSGGH